MHAKAEPHPRELSLARDGQITRPAPALSLGRPGWSGGCCTELLCSAAAHHRPLPPPLPALSADPCTASLFFLLSYLNSGVFIAHIMFSLPQTKKKEEKTAFFNLFSHCKLAGQRLLRIFCQMLHLDCTAKCLQSLSSKKKKKLILPQKYPKSKSDGELSILPTASFNFPSVLSMLTCERYEKVGEDQESVLVSTKEITFHHLILICSETF